MEIDTVRVRKRVRDRVGLPHTLPDLEAAGAMRLDYIFVAPRVEMHSNLDNHANLRCRQL